MTGRRFRALLSFFVSAVSGSCGRFYVGNEGRTHLRYDLRQAKGWCWRARCSLLQPDAQRQANAVLRGMVLFLQDVRSIVRFPFP